MRGFGYHFRLTPEEHAEAREALEQAVEQAPANADCWAMLSWIYSHEFAHDFNPRPGSLDRALDAAPPRRRPRPVESPRATGPGGRAVFPQGDAPAV